MFSAATAGASRSAVSAESSSANTASTGTATVNSAYCAQPPVTTWRPRPLAQYTRPATRDRNTTTRYMRATILVPSLPAAGSSRTMTLVRLSWAIIDSRVSAATAALLAA